PDENLVGQARRGEAAGFVALMRRHNRRVFRLARALTGQDAEAEDVVQEAWLRAFRHLDRYEGRGRFSTWLLRIAVHEALARRRHERRFAALEPDWEEVPAMSDRAAPHRPTPEDGAANAELRQALAEAVDALPESHRAVFVLRAVEGLSTAEAAAVLGLSEPNVKVRLHRARAALRQHLERRLGEEVVRLWAFDGERCDRAAARVLSALGVRGG
ncbi:MAG TPA: RNA polymerase sigma factor, partial [Thermoanaerobaculia bacterium]|nr:RNA polymerase sigma factor [Thermoanaerobaculia bacterium]